MSDLESTQKTHTSPPFPLNKYKLHYMNISVFMLPFKPLKSAKCEMITEMDILVCETCTFPCWHYWCCVGYEMNMKCVAPSVLWQVYGCEYCSLSRGVGRSTHAMVTSPPALSGSHHWISWPVGVFNIRVCVICCYKLISRLLLLVFIHISRLLCALDTEQMWVHKRFFFVMCVIYAEGVRADEWADG